MTKKKGEKDLNSRRCSRTRNISARPPLILKAPAPFNNQRGTRARLPKAGKITRRGFHREPSRGAKLRVRLRAFSYIFILSKISAGAFSARGDSKIERHVFSPYSGARVVTGASCSRLFWNRHVSPVWDALFVIDVGGYFDFDPGIRISCRECGRWMSRWTSRYSDFPRETVKGWERTLGSGARHIFVSVWISYFTGFLSSVRQVFILPSLRTLFRSLAGKWSLLIRFSSQKYTIFSYLYDFFSNALNLSIIIIYWKTALLWNFILRYNNIDS